MKLRNSKFLVGIQATLFIVVLCAFTQAGAAKAVTLTDCRDQTADGEDFIFTFSLAELPNGTDGIFTIFARGEYRSTSYYQIWDIDGLVSDYAGPNHGGTVIRIFDYDDIEWKQRFIINGALLSTIASDSLVTISLDLSSNVDAYGLSFVCVELTYATGDLMIEPADGLTASGIEGGPFTPVCKTYTWTNTDPNSLHWTATATQPWLDITPGSGTLASGASTTVDVCINANANNLPSGGYNDTVTFSDVTSGISQMRSVQLDVISTDQIYWGNWKTDKIRQADLDGRIIEDAVTHIGHPYDVDVDLINGKIYWTYGSDDRIRQANLDGSNIEPICIAGLGLKRGIAIDVFNGKIYWTNYGKKMIQRANLDGSNIENLVTTGLNHPYGIALDMLNGKMYWTDYSTNKIQRANLDGSNVEDLVTTGLSDPHYIALDIFNGKMYWTDPGYGAKKIQRANVDGSNVEDIVTGLSKPYGITVDSLRGKVYWTDYNANSIQRANLDGSNVENLITFNRSNPTGIVIPQIIEIDDLEITPYMGLYSESVEERPFSPTSVTYTLTNIGQSTINWTATKTAAWLDVLPASGVLNPNDNSTVEVRINSNVLGLSFGNYSDAIIFSNLDTGIQQRRHANLNVLLPEFKITASDADAGDYFGRSVAIDGDYAIVGAFRDDDNDSNSGSAYIFRRSGSIWLQQAKLTASDGAAGDNFGGSVAIDGDYAIVGAQFDDDNGSSSGSAYIFQRSGSAWIQQTKLTPSDGDSNEQFACSVAIDGDYAIVGAYRDKYTGVSGSAYIFKHNGSAWIEQTKLIASDGRGRSYGFSVSISGDYVIVGAPSSNMGTGSAYIYQHSDSSWIEQTRLIASDSCSGDYFGCSVSISGDYVIVGAYGDNQETGSAYIFQRSGGSWVQQTKLIASDSYSDDDFGRSVAISGDYVIVGAQSDDDNFSSTGSAYIFQRSGSSWVEQAKLTASDGDIQDFFGGFVAISGRVSIVGAALDEDNGTFSGSAYIFGNGNQAPVADAGEDQIVYARYDGMVVITLDGSESFDEDGDELSYSWRLGGQEIATGVNPTVEMVVNEPNIVIELIVSDGIEESEPDEVWITVVPALEVWMKITPRSLNCHSHGRWIKAHLILPEGFEVSEVDVNTPAQLIPLGIESDQLKVSVGEDGLVKIQALFTRSQFCEAAGNWPNEIIVCGLLTSGQSFYGKAGIREVTHGLKEIAELSYQWLQSGCKNPHWCDGMDINQDSVVNLRDFALFQNGYIEIFSD